MIIHPYTFRISTLLLETIQRKKYSLDKAFNNILLKYKDIKNPNQVYEITEKSLKNFAIADYILVKSGYINISLRRKSAFRIAYSLVINYNISLNEIKFISGGLLSSKLLRLLEKDKINNIIQEILSLEKIKKFSLIYSTPPWIIKILLKNIEEKKVERILEKNKKRIYWLRINTLTAKVNDIVKKLKKNNIEFTIDDDFPFLLKISRIDSRIKFHKLYIKLKYQVILQDKGSIIVVKSLDPQKNDIILDIAAAPGLKTSLIQQYTNNNSNIIATDISNKRVLEAKKLLKSLRVKNVSFITADGTSIKFTKKFNKILLDAPCSNSGAIRTDPAIRLILWNNPDLKIFHIIQKKLLNKAINLLAKDGILLYSTCSFSPVEGEKHFDKLLETASNIRLKPNINAWEGYKNYRCSRYVRRLFPYPHDTIGFFIARLLK